MKSSLMVLAFFAAGILVGHLNLAPAFILENDVSILMLYVLLFTAGMSVGFDIKALAILRQLKGRILLVPSGVVMGSLGGSVLASWVLPNISLTDCLAVGSGFGYYSLATVIMTKMGDASLGSVALLSNMIRELITLTMTPILVRMAGGLGPVMSGGAAAMDTCLPVIAKYSGERYAVIAIFSGMVLTLLVPLLVPAIMSLR